MTKTSGQPAAAAKKNPALLMMQIRQIHSYLGMLIAPSVLFFCVTGELQMFKLHESHGDYHPPAVVEKLGRLHKDQEFALGKKGQPPGQKPGGDKAKAPDAAQDKDKAKAPDAAPDKDKAGPGQDKPPAPKKAPNPAVLWLKIFFTIVDVGLVLSTLTGVWMVLKLNRRKTVCLALLAAGVVVPVLLTMMAAG